MLPTRHLRSGCRACVMLFLPLPGITQGAPLVWDPGQTEGTEPGGSGLFTVQATQPYWWDGVANIPWKDTTGEDEAILSRPASPLDPPPEHVILIPAGSFIIGNALTYAANGYTVTGPGEFNFRSAGGPAQPARLTVPVGITGTFSPSNNQGQPGAPPITIGGGGTLRWGPRAEGTRILLRDGTLVEASGPNQVLGAGTNTLLNGTLRLLPGTHDLIHDLACFAGSEVPGDSSGWLDLNGRTETIGNLSGNFRITNRGSASAAVSLSAPGNPLFTGVILDHPSDPAVTTGLTLLAAHPTAGRDPSQPLQVLTQRMGRPQLYSGPTILQKGNLVLDFNAATNPDTVDLLYQQFPATPLDPLQGQLIFAGTSFPGAPAGSGSRSVLTLNGKAGQAVSQKFRGLRLDEGAAAGFNFTAPSGSTGTSATLDLGPISRSPGSALNISSLSPATLTIRTSSGEANQLITGDGIPYMTVGGTHWVAKDPGNTLLVPATALYTPAGPFQLAGDANLVTGQDVRLTLDTTIRSLRHNLNERRAIDLHGHRLTAGAILIGSGTSITGSHLSGGPLSSPGKEFLLIHNASANYRYFGFGASLEDSAGQPVGFTKSGTGGTLFSGQSTATGPLNLLQGTLILTGSLRPSSIYLQGNSFGSNSGQVPVQQPSLNVLQIGNADTSGSLSETTPTGHAPISIGSLASLVLKRSDDLALENVVTGAGNFLQAGSGTTTLPSPSGHYSWTGDTIASAGILRLDYALHDTSRIPDLSQLRLGGGEVQLSGGTHVEVVRGVTLTAGASSLTQIAGSTGRFRLNGISGLQAAEALQSGGSTLHLQAGGIAETNTSNSNGILGELARVVVAGSDWATNSSGTSNGLIEAYTGYQPLALAAGSDSAHSQLTGPASLSGSRTTASLRVAATPSTPLAIQAAPDSLLTLTSGGLLFTGRGAISWTGGALQSGNLLLPELIVHNHSTAPVSLGASLTSSPASLTPAGINFSGPGTTFLTAGNFYGGTTWIHGGTLGIASDTHLGGANGTLLIEASATNSPEVTLSSANLPPGFGIGSRLLGQTVDAIEDVRVTLRGNATIGLSNATAAFVTAGPIVLNRGTLRARESVILSETNSSGTGGIMTLHRSVGLMGEGGTIEVDAGKSLALPGAVHGPGGLRKTGGGNLILASGNSFTATGPTVIAEGQILSTATSALGYFSDHTIGPGGTLDLTGSDTSVSQTIGSLAGSGTITNLGTAPSTLITGANFNSTTFSGLITNGSAAVALTKMGSGTLTLSGSNTYTGDTTIESGTLVLANTEGSATGSGLLYVNRTGTLAGTGNSAASAIIEGSLSPGLPAAPDPVGKLFVADALFLPNSLVEFDVGGPLPGHCDRLESTGTVSFTAGQEIRIRLSPQYTPTAGHSFDLVQCQFYNALDVNLVLPPLPAGLQWDINAFAADGVLRILPDGQLYRTWLNTHFTPEEQLDPALSGSTSDPDSDGLSNAMEFAAGTDPLDPGSGGSNALPVSQVFPDASGRNYVWLTFTALTAHLNGVAITGESSSQLGLWQDPMLEVSRTPAPSGYTTLVFRSRLPVIEGDSSFHRLKFLTEP